MSKIFIISPANCSGRRAKMVLQPNKYVNILLDSFGTRLHFPRDFVGRGDMSRGGLLLRSAADRQELSYLSFEGAVVHGKKLPKLFPRRYNSLFPCDDKEPM